MWFASSLTSPRSRLRSSRRASCRVTVERLEQRALPSFLGPINISFPYGARALAVGDFNNDGTPDLAVLASVSNLNDQPLMSVRLGKGNGTFGSARTYVVDPNSFSNPGAITVGDFNGDGKLDIVTANSDPVGGTISVLLGKGDGTFQNPLLYTLPVEPLAPAQYPVSLAVGDFNKDGKLDVVVTASYVNVTGVGYVNVLIGNGAGGFSADNSYLLDGQFPLWSVAVGDFNGDGNLDLALVEEVSSFVRVMLGNGDGTFGSGTDFYAGGTTASLAVGDFNGDGKLDVVTATVEPIATVTVLLGNGDGTFGSPISTSVPSAPGVGPVADFNRDGKPDLAVIDDLGVTVLLGNGDGTFRTDFTYFAGQAPTWMSAADFNRDGWPDLALVNGENTISTFFNLADWSGTPKAAQFVISAPSNVTAGVPFSLTVTVEDAYGNVVTGYTGTIHFSSTDTRAKLPADYTFTAADQGVHTFTGLVLRKKGHQHITVTDTLNMLLTGDVIVDAL